MKKNILLVLGIILLVLFNYFVDNYSKYSDLPDESKVYSASISETNTMVIKNNKAPEFKFFFKIFLITLIQLSILSLEITFILFRYSEIILLKLQEKITPVLYKSRFFLKPKFTCTF